MASLKDIVRQEYSDILDGIAWVVIYKEGRSWKCNYFYPESGDYHDGYIFSDADMEEMQEISEIDPNAICINGYYMGFGEDFTFQETENRVRWMYQNRLNQLQRDFLGVPTA